MIRVAAVGDLHVGEDSRGTLSAAFRELPDCADVLLLAGDLTRLGLEDELDVLVDELDGVAVPCAAVLGNHEYESDRATVLVKRLQGAGVHVLEGSSTEFVVDGRALDRLVRGSRDRCPAAL